MPLTAKEVAAFLAADLVGPAIEVRQPCALSTPVSGGVCFMRRFDPALAATLSGRTDLLAIVGPDAAGRLDPPHIVVANPRLAFARVLQRFFQPPRETGIAVTAVTESPLADRGDLTIGHGAVIGRGVSLGQDTEIRPHAVVGDETTVGARCLIRSHAVIGEEGFGFEPDESAVPTRVPQLGRVVIGNDVEIGAQSTVARAALAETHIGDHVKTDDLVSIAHNVRIGPRCLIMAGARILGSVEVGPDVEIGPGAMIATGIRLGAGAQIGMGSVVLRDVAPNTVVVGNPARVLRRR